MAGVFQPSVLPPLLHFIVTRGHVVQVPGAPQLHTSTLMH